MEWWNEALEVAAAESSSGIIGKARVEFGYKVYVSGAPQAETFFPAGAGKSDVDKRAQALASAKAYAQKAGQPQKPRWSLQIRVYRNAAASGGEPVTWKDDRFFVVNTFTDAFRVVVKSLQDAGIPSLPWEGWARIGFVNDPYYERQGEAGMVDQDADGSPRFPQVAVIREVFPNEEAARATVLGVAGGPSGRTPEAPPGYTPATWALVVPEIRKVVTAGKAIQQIAAEYGIDESWVQRAIS